jgi:hypothetical protein
MSATEQSTLALAKANRIRLERAAIKRRLRAHAATLDDVIGDECVQGMTAYDLVSELVRQRGQPTARTVERILSTVPIGPPRLVRELTGRQTAALVAAVDERRSVV